MKKIVFVDYENVKGFNLEGFETMKCEIIFFVGKDCIIANDKKIMEALSMPFVRKKKTPTTKLDLDTYLIEVANTKSRELKNGGPYELILVSNDKGLARKFTAIEKIKTRQISTLDFKNVYIK